MRVRHLVEHYNPMGGLMQTFGRPNRFLLCALVSALAMISEAQAAVSCHKINAKGIGQDLGGGVTNANIDGGGLLSGTPALP